MQLGKVPPPNDGSFPVDCLREQNRQTQRHSDSRHCAWLGKVFQSAKWYPMSLKSSSQRKVCQSLPIDNIRQSTAHRQGMVGMFWRLICINVLEEEMHGNALVKKKERVHSTSRCEESKTAGLLVNGIGRKTELCKFYQALFFDIFLGVGTLRLCSFLAAKELK